MNKNIINEELRIAYEALKECKIADDKGVIKKTFRGQISTFGAAVTTGSLEAAIAFFSDDGGSSVERSRLMKAILYILKKRGMAAGCSHLFEYAKEETAKEETLNAAIALKLAMNLYQLKEG